jgi:hypothetical protein
MMAFFPIALGGAHFNMYGIFRRNGNYTQTDAAIMVTYRSVNILGGIAQCEIAIDSLLFLRRKIDHSSARFWIQITIPRICQGEEEFIGFFDRPALTTTMHFLSGIYSTIMGGIEILMIDTAPSFSLFLQPCQLILFWWLNAGVQARHCELGTVYRSIFPVSSSPLSDLDQASALATGLLVALWPLITPDVGRIVMVALGIGPSPPPVARAANRAWVRNRANL